jgi:hypothetical protein
MSGQVGEGRAAADVGEPPSAAPAAGEAQRPRRGRRVLPLVLAVLLVTGVAGVGTYLSLRPKGPPEAPAGLQAIADLCLPPQCDAFTPTIELSWTAPSTGDPVTGYSILRDGNTLTDERLGPGQASYVDESVQMDKAYTYEVVAHSESGSSPPSGEADARLPEPPLRLAQLDGSFTIRYTVKHATNLGSFFGIRNPKPGERTTFDQRVYSVCASGEAACPTRWILGAQPLRPHGLTYRGSFVDESKARCFGGDRAPVRVRIALKVSDAGVSGRAWVVTAFSGTYSISFRCPGTLVSVGTLSMRARS